MAVVAYAIKYAIHSSSGHQLGNVSEYSMKRSIVSNGDHSTKKRMSIHKSFIITYV